MARRAMVAFVGGVAWVELFSVGDLFFRVLAVGAGVLIAVSYVRRPVLPLALVFVVFAIGMLRADSGPFEMGFIAKAQRRLGVFTTEFTRGISRALPEPHASYLNGLLVGARSEIPTDIREQFRKTGTSHVIALSGFNITIIVSYIGKAFSSLWFPVVGIAVFVLATGAQSSLVRAALMGSMALVAGRFGHRYDAGNALLVSVCAMLFFDPTLLVGDIGFQLSVAATLGLIYAAPPLLAYLAWVPERLGFRENLAITLAAQATTLPLIFYYFGTVSYLAPLVNVLILAAVPATMFFGFLLGIMAFASKFLAVAVAWPVWLLLTYQLRVVEFFARLI